MPRDSTSKLKETCRKYHTNCKLFFSFQMFKCEVCAQAQENFSMSLAKSHGRNIGWLSIFSAVMLFSMRTTLRPREPCGTKTCRHRK